MFELKAINNALIEKNKNKVKELYKGTRKIVVTAEWDNKYVVDQATQVENEEEQFKLVINNYNQNCEAAEKGFDNIPWICFFEDISWLMSIAYDCKVIKVNGLINSAPIYHEASEALSLKKRISIYNYGLYPILTQRIMEFQRRYGDLQINIPDNQSPIDITTQIIHAEAAMIGMFTEPEAIHHVLGLVTDSIIELNRYLKGIINNFGSYQPRRYLPVGMHFAEDDAAFLSPALYREFVMPYDQKISEEFGGIAFHCCMGQEQNLRNVADSKGFLSFDAMPDYNSINNILDAIEGKGVWNVYNLPWATSGDRGADWFKNIIERSEGRCGLYLNIHRPEKDEALRLAEKIKNYALK